MYMEVQELADRLSIVHYHEIVDLIKSISRPCLINRKRLSTEKAHCTKCGTLGLFPRLPAVTNVVYVASTLN